MIFPTKDLKDNKKKTAKSSDQVSSKEIETQKAKEESKSKREPKPKREPLVPAGEWVAPEMETVLDAVHERLKLTNGTVTNKWFGKDTKTTLDMNFEESDNNFPKADVNKIIESLPKGKSTR